MKKSTYTITFHASHNYGSMLQAYALQQTLIGLGVENKIINFRSLNQIAMYEVEDSSEGMKMQMIKFISQLIFPSLYKERILKFNLFEKFMTERLILTPETSDSSKIIDLTRDADVYITGSDQCWNEKCNDFDWAYYLTFTNSTNKISYASSFGPSSNSDKDKEITAELVKFKSISARESKSAERILRLTGVEVPVVPDPTLLLSSEQWNGIGGDDSLIKSPYLLIYTPYYKEGMYATAFKIADHYNLPVVITNYTGGRDAVKCLWKKKHYKLDVGPEEFLNLVRNADMVYSGSFHALVFSIIFHRPFWAHDGMNDNRMAQLLTEFGFEDKSVNSSNISQRLDANPIWDFSKTDDKIAEIRSHGIKYLKEALATKCQN